MKIRQYKKRFAICKDDNGKIIYAGDTVKLWLPLETSSEHVSKVYFNMLSGALVRCSPAHSFINEGRQSYRGLRDYLNQEPIPIHEYGSDVPTYKKGFCIKVKSFNKK